ncbi:hypothetical protein [Selenomonas sp. AB3002]|uniref:hypothetical protein n=1 Tax=Selenomonas sp. AB3002 TaxID=1392502 RepID=UPI001639CCF1
MKNVGLLEGLLNTSNAKQYNNLPVSKSKTGVAFTQFEKTKRDFSYPRIPTEFG